MQYVIQDANLVMKLTKHNNYEILDLMNAISLITDIPFDRVCHTGISTWWTNIVKEEFEKSNNNNYYNGKIIQVAMLLNL